ncbi:hypothetical protein [Phyllobacterium sp. YR531]|uniref:hypothetical protein n=1 Tax=Phyllobacterium sp. YR531 TaxID=1144343 RepID=UPI00026F98FB|nr:hypothetical protein [Phyllobacterium sp. YR531]EJN00529.1 hypothetical protein PMI41_03552 [Phyllobacterium sp. YR531]
MRKQSWPNELIPFCKFIPDPLPELPIKRWPRHPVQTDEQYEAQWEMNKRTHRRHVVMLALFQGMATAYGYHKTCNKAVCRRKQCCTGWRARNSVDNYDVPLFPLCGTIEMAERARAGVREMLAILISGHNPVVAPDGTLHPSEKMVVEET